LRRRTTDSPRFSPSATTAFALTAPLLRRSEQRTELIARSGSCTPASFRNRPRRGHSACQSGPMRVASGVRTRPLPTRPSGRLRWRATLHRKEAAMRGKEWT